MIKDYIVNASLLVAFVSILFQAFRNSGINPLLPVKYRVLSGGIFGVLGVILMIFSIHLPPKNVMLDFRYLAAILSAISGGWLSCIISSLIISTFRVVLFGVTESSITGVILVMALAVVYCATIQLKIKKQWKWLLLIGISEIFISLAYVFLIDDPKLQNHVILSYCLGFTVISVLLYFYVEYIETLTETYRKYKKEASRDFLTGLNNFRQFDVMYNNVIKEVKITQEKISLLYIDIDFFKKVNDTYGHKEGDIVLRELGEVLTKYCRSMDIVSRNGGEEFSIILLDCTPNIAVEIAERIRTVVENTPIQLSDNMKINITVSVGVASYPDPINNLEVLREKADEALYKAKRTGRNKVVLAQ